jgi:NitT/TauT family transport system permease protein
VARKPLEPISGWARVLLGVAGFAVVLGAWLLVAASGLVSRAVLAGPEETVHAGWMLFSERDLALDLGLTVVRVLAGFVIAAAVAIPLGVAIGAHKRVEAFFGPVVGFARYLPAAGFLPLLVLWFGIGEPQRLAMIFLAAFFQMTLMIAAAIASTPRAMIEVAYTLGTSPRRSLSRVMLPSAAPQIAEILRQVLAWAWNFVIFAELIGASRGVGHLITDSQALLATDQVIFGLLGIGVVALAIDLVLRAFNRRVFGWSGI